MKISLDYSVSLENIKRIQEIKTYEEIYNTISNTIIPLKIFTLFKGKHIYRARINEKKPFRFKNQISYRTDIEKINEYGRVNKIRQSIFYASHKPETTIFECSKLIKNKQLLEGIEKFTVGRWFVKKDITVLGIISNEDSQSVNSDLRKLYESSIVNSKIGENGNKILKFFADDFAKNVENNNEYMISCALFNFIVKHYKLQNISGVFYPSVGYELKDLNIALLPEIVDDSLILDNVAEYVFDTKQFEMRQISMVDIVEFKNNRL
ncbi:hypothetical protein [Perlabentimonas gracilis]|uniref:hypothetical protein n=1 Tax=Perlabentimonas gracilis TaxID=2715279 RepID=UPI0014098609|nr:hypothetical protein [Perlabentimonas gracilis]NHB70228.1 hypothetical protein [Perlabentimonas gracilis]